MKSIHHQYKREFYPDGSTGLGSESNVSETAGDLQYPKSNRVYSNYLKSDVTKEKYLVKFSCTQIWWKLFVKSSNVKTDLFPKRDKLSSINGNGYFCFMTRLFSSFKSTHNRSWPFFFLTETICAAVQYGDMLGLIIPRSKNRSVISRSHSWYAKRLGINKPKNLWTKLQS